MRRFLWCLTVEWVSVKVCRSCRRLPVKVTGFAENDPLDVGGGLLPDIPVVYLEGGGWILVKSLMHYYTIVPEDWPREGG